jgi:hypothetical protein
MTSFLKVGAPFFVLRIADFALGILTVDAMLVMTNAK